MGVLFFFADEILLIAKNALFLKHNIFSGKGGGRILPHPSVDTALDIQGLRNGLYRLVPAGVENSNRIGKIHRYIGTDYLTHGTPCNNLPEKFLIRYGVYVRTLERYLAVISCHQ